jgi:hypothetical protein
MPILALDGGAHSFIQGLQVYHGSNLLEYVDQYNTLYQLLIDQGLNPAEAGRTVAEGRSDGLEYAYHQNNKHVTKIGTTGTHTFGNNFLRSGNSSGGTRRQGLYARSGQVVSPIGMQAGALSHETTGHAEPIDVSSRSTFTCNEVAGRAGGSLVAVPIAKGASKTHTFCIPLVSGVVVAQMAKYLPVGALAADLRLELDLAPFEQALHMA